MLNILETHKFFSDDHNVNFQDKEIWSNGNLTYSCKNGDEVEYTDGKKSDSPFYGKKSDSPFYGKKCIQTLYITNKGTIQQNHEDDSFYFRLADDVTLSTYINGQLLSEDPDGLFNDHVTFANALMAK